jgi:HrpA-like RNA helicase
MTHDSVCVVKPLYAALPGYCKSEVEHFTDLAQYPENEGKRMICYSTNVAEAGITIPGIAAVIETGRAMDVRYDPILRMSTAAVEWISKASQIQRRGRAGRTAPGRCYATYRQETFESFPAYAAPAVTKIDLQPFYLNMYVRPIVVCVVHLPPPLLLLLVLSLLPLPFLAPPPPPLLPLLLQPAATCC